MAEQHTESQTKRRKVEHVTGNWAFLAFINVPKSPVWQNTQKVAEKFLEKQIGKPEPEDKNLLGLHITVSDVPEAALKTHFIRPLLESMTKEIEDSVFSKFELLVEKKLRLFYNDSKSVAYAASEILGPNPALDKLYAIVDKVTKKFIKTKKAGHGSSYKFHISYCKHLISGKERRPKKTEEAFKEDEDRPEEISITDLRLMIGDKIHVLPFVDTTESDLESFEG